jgi:hypothetical protein
MYENGDLSTYVNRRFRTDDCFMVGRHPLRTLSRPEPPPDLHDRIVAAIGAEVTRQQRRRRLRRYAAVGLAALLMLVATVHGGVR